MKNGMFGSRDAQCEKCRLIYRLGDEHVCRSASVENTDEEAKDEGQPDPMAEDSTEEAPKKRTRRTKEE